MAKQRVTLAQLRKAFEDVVPGFYDAWREAANTQLPGKWTEPNPRRAYANYQERTLTVSQAERQAAYEGRDIHFYKAGCVSLVAGRFADCDTAWEDLQSMDVRSSPLAEWDGVFYDKDTPLVKRWLMTMAVLTYVNPCYSVRREKARIFSG